jgi:OTU domain-containing protein 6
MRDNSDDFLPFLTNKQGDIMSPQDFTEYCQELETTAVWGGQPEVRT